MPFFASAREDRGLGSVEMWREAGAPSVTLVPEDEGARSLLGSADIIWLGGGSQSRLMESLERLELAARVAPGRRIQEQFVALPLLAVNAELKVLALDALDRPLNQENHIRSLLRFFKCASKLG